MVKHSSAAREEKPHVLETSRTNTIINALKRRAQAVLNDKSIDAQSRAIIRYGLETNDPWLAELVRRADAGESIDTLDFSQTPEAFEHCSSAEQNDDDSSEEKIKALAEIICRAGNDPTAALLVLMGKLERSTHPEVLANTVKHFAFMRRGELNQCRMVDAQIALLEGELLVRTG